MHNYYTFSACPTSVYTIVICLFCCQSVCCSELNDIVINIITCLFCILLAINSRLLWRLLRVTRQSPIMASLSSMNYASNLETQHLKYYN